MFYEKEFEAFANRTLAIDCPKIILTQRGSRDPVVISGSGSISTAQTGGFSIKVYATEVPLKTRVAMEKRLFRNTAGRLVPEDEYFSMEAETLGGATWTTDRTLIGTSINPSSSSMIIDGNPYWISNSSKSYSDTQRSWLTLYFYTSKEFPANTTTEEQYKVDGKPSRTAHSRNVAKFSSEGLEFLMTQEKDWRVLKVSCAAPTLPENLRDRLTEALSLTFGYETYPAITVIEQEGKRIVKLTRYRVDHPRQGFRPPLRFSHHDPFGDDFWQLFDKYFSHVMKQKGDHWHPLSCHVISAIRGSEGSLEAQALSLAVAVEGVLKSEFQSLGRPDLTTLKEIDDAREIIRKSNLGNSLKTRIESSIGNYKNPSASDRLMALVHQGKLRENLVKTWRRLRNAHAHGNPSEIDDFEQLLKDCQDVQTLLHELSFLVIGYQGVYSDYSELNWPSKRMEVAVTDKGKLIS